MSDYLYTPSHTDTLDAKRFSPYFPPMAPQWQTYFSPTHTTCKLVNLFQVLFHFKSNQAEEASGAMPLAGCTVEDAADERSAPNPYVSKLAVCESG